VGFIPTIPHHDAGRRTDPPVSVAIEISEDPNAMDPADPLG